MVGLTNEMKLDGSTHQFNLKVINK